MAKEQGLFANQGLDVSILPGGPEIDYIAAILSGKAQFGILATEGLLNHTRKESR